MGTTILDLVNFGVFGVRLGLGGFGIVVGELEKWIASLGLPPWSVVAVCVACVKALLLVCFFFGL